MEYIFSTAIFWKKCFLSWTKDDQMSETTRQDFVEGARDNRLVDSGLAPECRPSLG